MPDPGDAARLGTQAVARGFSLGVRIAAPFVVFGLVVNLGLGVLSRLMPQVQAFFLGLPLTVGFGMLVLLASLGLMTTLFLQDLAGFLREIGGR